MMGAVEPIRPRIRHKQYQNHICGNLTAHTLAQVDERAAAAGVARGRWLGQLITSRLDDLDELAARVVPLDTTDRTGPRVTVAATVGPGARDRIREVADRNGVAVARIVALVVDEELAGSSPKSGA